MRKALASQLETLRQEANTVKEEFENLPFPEFCAKWLVVQNQEGELVPLILNRIQRDFAKKLEKYPRILALKPRQVGISTVIQAWHYYNIVRGNTKASTLCHDSDLTDELRAVADRFHDNIPEQYRPVRKYANAKVTTYPDKNSQARIATVGGHGTENSSSKRKGRGGSNTDIHGTEVAFWPDALGVMSAAMQAGKPRIVLESTPNGMVGQFYEWCMQALDGKGVWILAFYEWWWNEAYQLSYAEYCERIPNAPETPAPFSSDEQALVEKHGLSAEQIYWRRWKQAELPHTFEQEYPEDPRSCFLASGKSYFRNVEHVFVAPFDVVRNSSRRYVGGLDFAQTGDFTVLVIIDTVTNQMVDYLRVNNKSWQEMRVEVAKLAHKWNAEILGEANSMGKTNIELLQSGEYAEDGTQLYKGIRLTPFDTTPTSKPPLIQGLYHALHELGLKLLDISELRHELRAFISKQSSSGHWQYMAGGGAHDDFVMALALSVHASHSSAVMKELPVPNWWDDINA